MTQPDPRLQRRHIDGDLERLENSEDADDAEEAQDAQHAECRGIDEGVGALPSGVSACDVCGCVCARVFSW